MRHPNKCVDEKCATNPARPELTGPYWLYLLQFLLFHTIRIQRVTILKVLCILWKFSMAQLSMQRPTNHKPTHGRSTSAQVYKIPSPRLHPYIDVPLNASLPCINLIRSCLYRLMDHLTGLVTVCWWVVACKEDNRNDWCASIYYYLIGSGSRGLWRLC
jgi:hypothetical protein